MDPRRVPTVTHLRHPILYTLLIAVLATGCATLSGDDPGARSAQQIIDDQNIEASVKKHIKASDARFDSSHLVIVSHKGVVLLAGQVESDDLATRAQQVAESVEDVRSVHNELSVGGVTTLGARSNDVWITTKIKSAMASHEAVDSDRVNVTTVDGVVYLMGTVGREQADAAVAVAQSIVGVKKIVKVFEYLD
jgi:osmotically-inducible protein OsmY